MTDFNRRKFLITIAGLVLAGPLAFSASNKVYTVRKGDNLTKIAKKYGVSVKELQSTNGIKGSLIKVGEKLVIPEKSTVLSEVISETNKIWVNRRKWKYIVAHHSATSQGSAKSFDKVDRRHGMENGLAYHFVIGNGKGSPDGKIEVGSRWKKQLHGGHVRKWEYNNHGIGICLVGNFEKTKPTAKQMESFNLLMDYLGGNILKKRYKFMVHKEVNATLCPGRNFPTKAMHKLYG